MRKAGSSDTRRSEMKTYDAGGQVCSITGERDGKPYTYVADIRYDEYGQRAYIKYGNGVETNYTYDENMRWLKHIDTENKYGTQYQNINYSFDDVGNVLGYKNDCMNGARYSTEQKYTYDALYQLIKAEGVTEDNPYAIPNSPDYRSNYEQNFSFDAIGNMMHKDSKETITPAIQKKGGDDLNYDLTYEYDANYAHRLTRAGSEQKGWRYYTYDDNGNVTSESDGIAPNEDTATLTPVTVTTHTNEAGDSVYEADYAWAWPWSDDDNNGSKPSPRNKRIYEWNSRNLLMRSIALGYDTRYAYGADGNRAAKWTAGNLSETLYFNTMWTWHIEKGLSQEQQGQYSKHIYLGETRIVTKQTSDLEKHYGQSEERNHQYYYHPDHLGSAQLVTDYEGNEYQRIEYTPYGELWVEKKTANEKGMRYLPYKFTAKEQDEETGLYYYGARYLDAKYSRWLSTDPAVSEYINGNSTSGGLYNTVNFNLYHYAGNNPVKYTDPDGNAFNIIAGALIGGGFAALKAVCDGKTGREVVAAAVRGAVFGGMVAATAGLALGAQLAGGAIAGTTAYLAESIVAGKQATLEDATISAAARTAAVMAGKILEKAVGTVIKGNNPSKTPDKIRDNSKLFSKAKQDLIEMAKQDKKAGGITKSDMQAYIDLNKELPDHGNQVLPKRGNNA